MQNYLAKNRFVQSLEPGKIMLVLFSIYFATFPIKHDLVCWDEILSFMKDSYQYKIIVTKHIL